MHVDRSKEQVSYASDQVYLIHKLIPKAKTHSEAIYVFKKKEVISPSTHFLKEFSNYSYKVMSEKFSRVQPI